MDQPLDFQFHKLLRDITLAEAELRELHDRFVEAVKAQSDDPVMLALLASLTDTRTCTATVLQAIAAYIAD